MRNTKSCVLSSKRFFRVRIGYTIYELADQELLACDPAVEQQISIALEWEANRVVLKYSI